MEIKVIPMYVKSIEGRSVTGLFAVHGVVDLVADRSHPGSFSKTLREQAAKTIKYLWSHNMGWAPKPPIAVIEDIKEVGREAIPGEVLAKWPEATGAVEVKRKYLQTARAEEVYQGLLEGAIDQQSYGYDPVKVDFTNVQNPGTASGPSEGVYKIRELREIRLYEVSDVVWGANPATVASKLYAHNPEQALSTIKAILDSLEMQYKAGARHSSNDTTLLNSIHKAVVSLGCNNCKGLLEEDEEGEKATSPGAESKVDQETLPTAAVPLDTLYLLKHQIELLSL